MDPADARQVALWISEAGAGATMAFSGAGASAESGIDTFRDHGGIWDRYDAAEVGTPAGLMGLWEQNPKRLGQFVAELVEGFSHAAPNPGHQALTMMESAGWLDSVITQNVDNLHQDAGSHEVIEIHGSLIRHRCTSCHQTHHMTTRQVMDYASRLAQSLKLGDADISLLPECHSCFHLLRPDIVLFTEPVPALGKAMEAIGRCKVMLVVGTSGVVEPAAQVPWAAKRAGAKLIDINPHKSAYSDASDLWIALPAGQVLPLIVEQLNMEPLKGTAHIRAAHQTPTRDT